MAYVPRSGRRTTKIEEEYFNDTYKDVLEEAKKLREEVLADARRDISDARRDIPAEARLQSKLAEHIARIVDLDLLVGDTGGCHNAHHIALAQTTVAGRSGTRRNRSSKAGRGQRNGAHPNDVTSAHGEPPLSDARIVKRCPSG